MFLFHFSNLDNVNYINILSFIKNIILSILCVVIFVYDVKYMEIPDEIVIPGALIILIINVIITKNITSIYSWRSCWNIILFNTIFRIKRNVGWWRRFKNRISYWG